MLVRNNVVALSAAQSDNHVTTGQYRNYEQTESKQDINNAVIA